MVKAYGTWKEELCADIKEIHVFVNGTAKTAASCDADKSDVLAYLNSVCYKNGFSNTFTLFSGEMDSCKGDGCNGCVDNKCCDCDSTDKDDADDSYVYSVVYRLDLSLELEDTDYTNFIGDLSGIQVSELPESVDGYSIVVLSGLHESSVLQASNRAYRGAFGVGAEKLADLLGIPINADTVINDFDAEEVETFCSYGGDLCCTFCRRFVCKEDKEGISCFVAVYENINTVEFDVQCKVQVSMASRASLSY